MSHYCQPKYLGRHQSSQGFHLWRFLRQMDNHLQHHHSHPRHCQGTVFHQEGSRRLDQNNHHHRNLSTLACQLLSCQMSMDSHQENCRPDYLRTHPHRHQNIVCHLMVMRLFGQPNRHHRYLDIQEFHLRLSYPKPLDRSQDLFHQYCPHTHLHQHHAIELNHFRIYPPCLPIHHYRYLDSLGCYSATNPRMW